MNNDELHQFANDFRRLRSEMIERSNQILSMFEIALKRSATAKTSNEQFSYLDFGLRITEGDYVSSPDNGQQLLQTEIFSENEKGPKSRSLGASQPGNLNVGGAAGVSQSKSMNIWEPLKRSLTSTLKSPSTLLRRSSGTQEQEHTSRKKPAKEETTNISSAQLNQANETPEYLVPNALCAMRPGLSIVTEGISPNSSFTSAEPPFTPPSPNCLPELYFPVKLTQNLLGQDSFKDRLVLPLHYAPIEFNNCVVPRFLLSNSSSLDANASEDSMEISVAVASSSAKTPNFVDIHRSLSHRRAPSTTYQFHSLPLQKSDSVETTKRETPEIQCKSPSNKREDPNMQPSNFLEYFFLFPAYDYKGRRVTVASLAAFGKLNPVFHLNGIHPRSLFSNMWDLTLGFAMFVLLWLIPFIAAYNPIYNICDINFLAASISTIFLCDSVVSLVTPQLISGDYSFDISEYERARPILPVWSTHWMKRNFLINLLAVIPFTVFFKSQMHKEFVLFVSLIRCFKLWRNFHQCPTIIYAAWRLDEVANMSISGILPLIGGIFWFIHWWSVLWPLVDSATLFEIYVWTYYKAVGNMFPTSFNPWSASEQIVSLIFIILAAVVYAIFLGATSSTVMAMNPSGRLFAQKVGELRDYIRSKDLSKDTEERLLTYYETRYRGKYFEEDSLLSDLNDSLKAEILLQNTRRLIMNVPFLKRTAGDGRDELFLGRIAAALRSISYIAGDYVTKQGDSGSDMYFIFHGKADVSVNESLVVTLGAGAYFGEVGLITKTLRTATVQAMLPSLMYRLTYIDFHKILDDFTDMKSRMDMLAEEREKVVKLEERNKNAIS